MKINDNDSRNYDRLIEDKERRSKGQFYTPKIFADYAHELISNTLGDNWKDEYVVWDNCCGTKNLTRDYRFKELYCSTLENAELEISSRYNPEAVSFQFDFLNDDLDKLPKGLLEAFEKNKKIVFFLNPPYAGASNIGDSAKKGLCQTMINDLMKQNKIGAASQNLYSQFLYRIAYLKRQYNLTNCYIALFSPTIYLTGSSWKKFREFYLNNFNLVNAIQFQASHFANVSGAWGIGFTIWKNGEQLDKNNFNFDIVDSINGTIKHIKQKVVYNNDNNIPLNKWAYPKEKFNSIAAPNFSSALNVSQNNTKMEENAFGYMFNGSNDIDKNMQNVSIFTTAFSSGHGINIHSENFERCMILCACRKLIFGDWINYKDEYIAPTKEIQLTEKYKCFSNDSIVFSIFHSGSGQAASMASLRNVNYHDKLWDIKNEFFWMSKSEIESLANKYNNDDCYNDAHTSSERFVYNKLQTITLSAEAQAVLDKASDIVRNTFKYRELFNQEHPEYQINNWDCGWYQIKALCKEFMPELLKEFKDVYKVLADKMRPMVYELGFLK